MGRDPECVFCKIGAGELPCTKVFEDDESIAFLDIAPLSDGHVLLIPKEHYERLEQMPVEAVARLAAHLPKLARAVMQVTQAEGYNVLQNNGRVSGQVVPHVHFHIIPRVGGDALGYRWPAGRLDKDRARQLQEQITAALGS